MQASELYEIMKDVPREAWPRGVGYSHALLSFEHAQEKTHTVFDDDHAEAMFVGSMTAWLLSLHELDLRPEANEGRVEYLSVKFGYDDWVGGTSIVEALAKVCKEVK
jgi:hypothetical protein